MANKFEKRTWPDRQSQHPARRRLIPTDTEGTYDVEREEGEVTEAGRSFSKENMEDLEERIYAAFENLDAADITLIDSEKHFTANTVEEALKELFQYAADGKAAIAGALNTSASNTFDGLAAKIRNFITDKNAQIESQNEELQNRKRWYYGQITISKGTSNESNSGSVKSSAASIDFNIDFGFLPAFLVVYSIENNSPIIYCNSSTYLHAVAITADAYPADGWKAGVLVTANKLTIKVWSVAKNGGKQIVQIKPGTYHVLAVSG